MDGIMADKYKEVKYTSGASCNREITKEKSVRKEVRYERMQKGLKIRHKKIKLIWYSLDLRHYIA